MKNLKLWKEVSSKIGLQSEKGETVLLSAFDFERNRLFFSSSEDVLYSISLSVSQSQDEHPWRKVLLSSEDESVTEHGDHITALDYLEDESLIVGTSNGYLVLHNVDIDVTEVVGRVEGGIKSINCSPDGALLTVITGLGQLLLMTHDWEVLYEVSLDNPQFLAGASIGEMGHTVYQFDSNISWRGDGKYFATLSGSCEPYSLKKLKIWERESGAIHATAESSDFIGECLAWMPSGAKVAIAQDRESENCPSIVFFERNGLERSRFSTEVVSGTVIESLKWNSDSNLLAASIRCDRYDAIRIWSFSNYHWYMKQEIRFLQIDRVKFLWDPTKPMHLICWTAKGKITSYNFVWITAVTEASSAFVIDGSRILISPLDMSLIPPPMFLFCLKYPSTVQETAYYCNNSKSYLAACLSDGGLCITEFPPTDTWELLEGSEFILEASHSDFPIATMRHLTWLDSHILIGASCFDFNQPGLFPPHLTTENGNACEEMMGKWVGSSFLQEIELEHSENCIPEAVTSSGWYVKNSKKLSSGGLIIGIVPNPAKNCSCFLQLDGGSVLEYFSSLNLIITPTHDLCSDGGFLSSCPWMKDALVFEDNILKPLVLGLDGIGRLQIGKWILCSNCNSFSLYSDSKGLMQKTASHLILTTKQDLLFVVNMDDILHGYREKRIESFTLGSNILYKKDERQDCLNIWERGAKLVGAIHGDEAAVILQAVRGNLECIYPRKLVIAAIANALNCCRFKDAMHMVRRHRIDFNIIVDYIGLPAFLRSTGEFVSQITDLGHITEFVCAIKNENVMHTLYKTILSLSVSEVVSTTNACDLGNAAMSKVSSLLLAIRKSLEEFVVESPARELCILTTLARSEPPALEEALRRIKVTRDWELSGEIDAFRKLYPSAEEALKHLLWLSNDEDVYDAALGLYDLNIAAIVALNSDKDPKEFLPFLQELERMDPVIMRYTIDLRLHRYESALKHIASAAGDFFGDCMTLMKSNPELFPLGLELFSDQVKRYQILEAWGDHLLDEKRFKDAATTFLCCSSLQKALEAYRACGDWRGVLTMAGLLQLRNDEILQLASDICDELQALGKPSEAAKVSLEYCLDVSTGVGYYIIAREWQEALRISYLHKREDLINEVETAALECANTLLHEYVEALEKVGKYAARYLAVRQRRLVIAAKIELEDRPTSDVDEENASETSSNLSGMSVYSTGTTKESSVSICSSATNKRREKRKQRNKGKIRAGSPGEELALLEHLKGISITDSAQRELKSLLDALIMLGKEEPASRLQRAADSFQMSQLAAVKLTEEASSSDKIDENTQSLDHYLKCFKENFSSWMPFSHTRLLLSQSLK